MSDLGSKEGTKVAPEFVTSPSPFPNVAFDTATLKHTSQFNWAGNELLHFLGDIWPGWLCSAFSLSFTFPRRGKPRCPWHAVKGSSARHLDHLRKQPHASPLVFTLCRSALIQGGSLCYVNVNLWSLGAVAVPALNFLKKGITNLLKSKSFKESSLKKQKRKLTC